MIAALEDFSITGVETPAPVQLKIMRDANFAAGRYDPGFIGRLLR